MPIILYVVAALSMAACGTEPEPLQTTTTWTTSSTLRPALPDSASLLELERSVGSSPSLEHGIALPAPPLADLDGVPGSSPAAGPADAIVNVTLFTDFQCPVCRRIVEPMKLLVRRYPDEVRLVVKHTASPLHARAEDAAAASLAALRQEAFWEFFDQTFVDQRRLGVSDFLATAQSLGLDVQRFHADMADESVREQVRYETSLAEQLDVASTPSFVVNGRIQRGWGSYGGIESLVQRELARARTLLDSGVPRSAVAREATRTSDPETGPALAAALFGDAG